MGQAAEILGIIAALGSLLRGAGDGDAPAPFVSLAASRSAARSRAPLVGARFWRAATLAAPSDWLDITPQPGQGGGIAATVAPGAVARLAEAVRPAAERLEAMALGTGLSSFSLTVRLADEAAAPPRLEVVSVAVEGLDVVEATSAWSWQNRFRDPEAAALATALVMSALAQADEGIERDAMLPHAIHGASGTEAEASSATAPTATAIERWLTPRPQPVLRLDGIDADHVLRRLAAWRDGMRRATGRPDFAASPEGLVAAASAEAAADLEADLFLGAGRPLAAAE